MVGYFPAELYLRWNRRSNNAAENPDDIPQNARYISASPILNLSENAQEDVVKAINDFVYTSIFLGRAIGEIVSSNLSETTHFLVRKTLIGNPFVHCYHEIPTGKELVILVQFTSANRS